jgi:hypothetical protein
MSFLLKVATAANAAMKKPGKLETKLVISLINPSLLVTFLIGMNNKITVHVIMVKRNGSSQS